ncbi:MAG: malonyl-ACP O-methyltransferase BioC [Thermodesulfovibrionia bacterium]|nr:malonyl-ACP O-methyltransferase BioC [Thermodesulfovibrionia bacterium]
MILQKDKIESAFSQAAKTYDAHADIQKESAARLMLLLENIDPTSILEVGGATGNYTIQLSERFPKASITSVDFSPAMIEIAKTKLFGNSHVNFICRDAEKLLNETDKMYGLITSNAALQWFTDINNSLINIKKLLSPHGIFLFSVFGPQTFHELSNALDHIYGRPITLPAHSFSQEEKLLSMLHDIFERVVLEEVNLTRKYASTLELLRHIKKTGATGGRPSLSLNKSMLRTMDDWFKQNHGECTATYQLFFVTARNK